MSRLHDPGQTPSDAARTRGDARDGDNGDQAAAVQLSAARIGQRFGGALTGAAPDQPRHVSLSRSLIARQFGVEPRADVELKSGDGVAESAGAAAVTRGERIHFADATIDRERGPEPGLLGHELTHVAQQSPGPRRSQPGGDLEGEADRGGAAMRAGHALPVSGHAAPGQLQAKSVMSWWEESWGWSDEVSAQKRRDQRDQARASVDQRDERTLGGHTITDPATGASKQRATSGRESHDGAFTWDWSTRSFKSTIGSREYSTDDNGERTTETDLFDTEVGPNRIGSRSQRGESVEVLDVAAMAKAAEADLDIELRVLDAEEEKLRQRPVAMPSKTISGMNPGPELDPDEEARRDLRRAEIAEERARLEKTKARLASGEIDEAELSAIAARHRINVAPKYKVTSANMVEESSGLEQDLLGGNAGWRGGKTTTVTDSDGSATDSHELLVNAHIGGGHIGGGATLTDEAQVADSDGNQVSKRKNTRSYQGGLVADKKLGRGVFAAFNQSEENTGTDGVTRTGSRNLSGGVTDKGAFASGGWSREAESGGCKRSFAISGDASFTVAITAVPASDDYKLVATLSLGASLPVSIGTADKKPGQGGVSASASLVASGSAELVYAHTMTSAEVEDYLLTSNAVAAGGKSSARPEFNVLESLLALVSEEGKDDAVLGVLGSADSAADMPVGDSIALTTTGKLGASANLGYKSKGGMGVNLEGSIEGSWTRTAKIDKSFDSKRKRDVVTISIGFVEADSESAKVSGQVSEVAARYGLSQSSSSGVEVTFKLDPASAAYQNYYGDIITVAGIEELGELANREDLVADGVVCKRTDSASDDSSVEVGVGGTRLPFGLGEVRRSFGSESVTVDYEKQRLSGVFAGGQDYDFAADGGGLWDAKWMQYNQQGAATGKLDENGDMSLEISATTAESDHLQTLSDFDELSLEDLTKGNPADFLKGQLEKTYATVRSFNVPPEHIGEIVKRAGFPLTWSHCCRALDSDQQAAWETLRGELVEPEPESEWVEINPKQADELARLRSLAAYMKESGTHGYTAMRNMLREWGSDGRSQGTGKDLGVWFTVPPSLANTKKSYDQLQDTVKQLPTQLEGLANAGQASSGWSILDKVDNDASKIIGEVQSCADIDSDRSRIEMIGQAQILKEKALALHDKLHLAHQLGYWPRDKKTDKEAQWEQALLWTSGDRYGGITMGGSDPAATIHCEHLVEQCEMMADSEFQMFERVEKERYYLGFELDKTADGAIIAVQVADLHEHWIAIINELRDSYGAAGIEVDFWAVSDKGAHTRERNPQLEPDVDRQIELYEKCSQVPRRDLINAWRQRGDRY